MELLSEEKNEKQNQGKKYVGFAIVIAIILLVLIFVSILVLQQAQKNKEKLNVDGKKVSLPANLTMVDSQTGVTYISISKIAQLVGYNYYNGDYQQYSEDKTKCYVENEKQVSTLELNSNIIYKNTSEDKVNFDIYKVDLPVKSFKDSLYATQDAIQTAFNVSISYKTDNKTLYVYTLPYMCKVYDEELKKAGYTGITADFMTQKAIIKDMIVVVKDEKYGVVSATDYSTIIGTKYDNLTYLESTKEFIATNLEKTGIITVEGEQKIGLSYEEIGLIDSQQELYYVKKDNLYGALNKNGKVLLNMEYVEMGVDKQSFISDNIKNSMFLYENCIPIKKGDKWGIANKNGNIILSTIYDNIGYIQTLAEGETLDKSINNAVIIPNIYIDGQSIEGIVIGRNGKYGVASSNGNVIINCEYDKIYSITTEGENVYYMEKNGKVIKVADYVEANKMIIKGLISNYQNVLDITFDENAITNNTTKR